MSLLDALLLDPAPFEVWIANRTDGIKGCGTISDPLNGATQPLFDAAMQQIAAQHAGRTIAIRIGPGVFETNGYPTVGGWKIKAGVRIRGSGIDVTTLKLVNVVGGTPTYAIGHPLTHLDRVDFAEVSDLTIDCNLPAGVAFDIRGAVRLMGEHVKIHRVKAIHWGAHTGPCLVFSVVTADVEGPLLEPPVPAELSHGGIEQCLAIQPGSGHHGTAVAFHIGGAEVSSFTREFHGRSPFVRHCHVDAGEAPGVTGVSASWCRGAVVEGNQIYNCAMGVSQTALSSRDLIVRNNFMHNVSLGISVPLGAGGVLGTSGTLTRVGSVLTITGISTTTLSAGDRIVLSTDEPLTFDGVYVVTAILSSTSFTLTTTVTTSTGAGADVVRAVRSVARVILDANVIELAPDGSAVSIDDNNHSSPYPEAPDYVHGDVIIRDNKVRYMDGVPPEDPEAALIEVAGARHLIVQNNVLDTVALEPIQTARCGSETYFDNRTPTAALAPPPAPATDRIVTDMEMPANDALALACFNES